MTKLEINTILKKCLRSVKTYPLSIENRIFANSLLNIVSTGRRTLSAPLLWTIPIRHRRFDRSTIFTAIKPAGRIPVINNTSPG